MSEDLNKQEQAAQTTQLNITRFLEKNGKELPSEISSALEALRNTARDIAAQINPEEKKSADASLVARFHLQLREVSDQVGETVADASRAGSRASSDQLEALRSASGMLLSSGSAMQSAGLKDPARNSKPKDGEELTAYVTAIVEQANSRQLRLAPDAKIDIVPIVSAMNEVYDKDGKLNSEQLAVFNDRINEARNQANRQSMSANVRVVELNERLETMVSGDERKNLEKELAGLQQSMRATNEFSTRLDEARDAVYKFAGIEQPKPQAIKAAQEFTIQNRAGALEYILMMSSGNVANLKIDGKPQSNLALFGAVEGIRNEHTRKMFRDDLATINQTTFEIARGVKEYNADNFKPVVEAVNSIRTRAEAILNAANSDDPAIRDFYSDQDRESARKILTETKPMSDAIQGIRDGKIAAGASRNDPLADLIPDDMRNGPRFAVASTENAYLQAGGRGGSISRA